MQLVFVPLIPQYLSPDQDVLQVAQLLLLRCVVACNRKSVQLFPYSLDRYADEVFSSCALQFAAATNTAAKIERGEAVKGVEMMKVRRQQPLPHLRCSEFFDDRAFMTRCGRPVVSPFRLQQDSSAHCVFFAGCRANLPGRDGRGVHRRPRQG